MGASDEQRKFVVGNLVAVHYMLPMYYYHPIKGEVVDIKSNVVKQLVVLGLICQVDGSRYTLTEEGKEALVAHFNR